MSIITRIRSSVKPTVLFDATVRHAAPRSFGRGLLRSLPSYRAPFTSEDEAWAVEQFSTTAEDRHFDALCLQSAMQDRYERGHVL